MSKTPTVSIPPMISMLIKSMGLDPQEIQQKVSTVINEVVKLVESGAIQKLAESLETLQRIEQKQDLILEKLQNGSESKRRSNSQQSC